MFRQLGLPAWVALYLFAVPLAIIVGVSISDPLAPTSLLALAMIIGLGVAPIVLRFYHESLIVAWNSALVIFFLPGRPTLAMALVALCLLMAVVNRAMVRQPLMLPARSITAPLLVLGAVVFLTAAISGGVTGRAFGGEMWGARRYAATVFGIIGFFALASRPVPVERAGLLTALFFLSAVTSALGDLAYSMGWEYLFLILSTDVAILQAASEYFGSFVRLTGVCWAAWAVFNFLLMRYGISGLLDFTRPHRLILAIAAFAGTMLGGYRSYIVLSALLIGILFLLEGLHRTKVLAVAIALGALTLGLVLPNVRSLPLAFQRSLSILPVDIDPVAKHDAQGTLDWRFEMWKAVIPEVPQYLLIGKGFAYSGTDYYLTQEAFRRGLIRASYEDTIISGNYHNGILTLIIPFGIWGVLAFIWFCTAACRALIRNYRYGDTRLKTLNRFLLASFLMRLIFYVGVYGQFDLDIATFTGLIGMSVAVNGGIRSPVEAPVSAPTAPAPEPTFPRRRRRIGPSLNPA
ncbi:MAG: O-antigen ligase family protein [Verrucomicrobiales bacterium]|nr:O-antigen ligase family protein [Verrucomicrobiales bacterium]